MRDTEQAGRRLLKGAWFQSIGLRVEYIKLILLAIAASGLAAMAMNAVLQGWQQRELTRAELFWNGYAKLYAEQSGGWEGLQERLATDGYAYGGDSSFSLIVYEEENRVVATAGELPWNDSRKMAVLSQGNIIGYTQVSIPSPAYAGYLMFGLPVALTLIVLGAGAWHLRRVRSAKAAATLAAARHIGGKLGRSALRSEAEHVLDAWSGSARRLEEAAEAGMHAAGESAQELMQRNEKLETVRRTMVADIAHELRTPIAIMRTQLDHAIQDGRALPLQKAVLLHDETLRLTRLVRELQELSLAESGHLPLTKGWFSLSELAGEVLEALAAEAEERHIASSLTGDMNVRMYGDRNRIRQILINLVGNAFLHARGHVDVKTALDGSMAVIAVSDDGWGIEEEDQERVFERFYRGQAPDKRKDRSAGLGLGLAIVKEFASAHQGSAEVNSTFGEGTSFVVRLPVFSE